MMPFYPIAWTYPVIVNGMWYTVVMPFVPTHPYQLPQVQPSNCVIVKPTSPHEDANVAKRKTVALVTDEDIVIDTLISMSG